MASQCAQKKFPGSFDVFINVCGKKVLIWTIEPRNPQKEIALATKIYHTVRKIPYDEKNIPFDEKEWVEETEAPRGPPLETRVTRASSRRDKGPPSDVPTAPTAPAANEKSPKIERPLPTPFQSPQIQIRGSSKLVPTAADQKQPNPMATAPKDPPHSKPVPSATHEKGEPSCTPTELPYPTLRAGTEPANRPNGSSSPRKSTEQESAYPFTTLSRLKATEEREERAKQEIASLKAELTLHKQEMATLKKRKREENTDDDERKTKRRQENNDQGHIRPARQEHINAPQISSLKAQKSTLEQEVAALKCSNKAKESKFEEEMARLRDQNAVLLQRMQSAGDAHRTEVNTIGQEKLALREQLKLLNPSVQGNPTAKGSLEASQRLELVKNHLSGFMSKHNFGKYVQDSLDCAPKEFTQEHIEWFFTTKNLLEREVATEKASRSRGPNESSPRSKQNWNFDLLKESASLRKKLESQTNASSTGNAVPEEKMEGHSLDTALEQNKQEVEELKRKISTTQVDVVKLKQLKEKSTIELSTLKREYGAFKVKSSDTIVALERQIEAKSKTAEQNRGLHDELRNKCSKLKIALDKQIESKSEVLRQKKKLHDELEILNTTSMYIKSTSKEQLEELAQKNNLQQEEFSAFKTTSSNKNQALEKQLEDLWATYNDTKLALETRIQDLMTESAEARMAYENELSSKQADIALQSAELSLIMRQELASFQQSERNLAQQNVTYREIVTVLQDHKSELQSIVAELRKRLDYIRNAIDGTSCDDFGTSSLVEFETREAKLIEKLGLL